MIKKIETYERTVLVLKEKNKTITRSLKMITLKK